MFPGISTKELEGSGSRSGSGEGEEFESSGLRNGRECILNFLMMNTEINRNVITSLGELGIVGVLCFDDVIREDTDNYTCTISNELPQTTRITGTSNPVSLIVLGEMRLKHRCPFYTLWENFYHCVQYLAHGI